jgi:hypothetical protein
MSSAVVYMYSVSMKNNYISENMSPLLNELRYETLCTKFYHHSVISMQGYRIRFSDWLRAERPRGRSSSPSRLENFLFLMLTRPGSEPIQPHIQCVSRSLHGSEADHLQLVPS